MSLTCHYSHTNIKWVRCHISTGCKSTLCPRKTCRISRETSDTHSLYPTVSLLQLVSVSRLKLRDNQFAHVIFTVHHITDEMSFFGPSHGVSSSRALLELTRPAKDHQSCQPRDTICCCHAVTHSCNICRLLNSLMYTKLVCWQNYSDEPRRTARLV